MSKVLLIDCDSVVYRAAASAEGLTSSIAIARAHETIERIRMVTDCSECTLVFSGTSNFRHRLNINYKANRVAKQRPEFIGDCNTSLRATYNSTAIDNLEGDDTLRITYNRTTILGQDTVLASLDKDILQIPGTHYNWVKDEFKEIDEHQALVNFYTQFILGDRADNIMGFDGIARITCPKFLRPKVEELEGCETEEQMLEIIRDMYNYEDDRVLLNGNLLYLLQHEEDYWLPNTLKASLTGLNHSELGREQLYDYIVMTQAGSEPCMEPTSPTKNGFQQHGDLTVGI